MACRVLVVEDDSDLREMMAELLRAEGFEPDLATDGIDALAKLRARPDQPHVILLDMMMPRMDGWTFCRQQADEPVFSRIPVIVVSAAPRESLRSVCAVAIVPKPFDYQELIDTLRAHC